MRKGFVISILIFVVACATMRQSAEPAGSVARIWHGRVPDARAEEYYAYLKSADVEKTHNLPRDPEFLIEMEPNVRQFTIRLSDRK